MTTSSLKKTTDLLDQDNIRAWKMVRTNPAQTIQISKDVLEKSINADYKKGIAWATGNIGTANTWMSNYEEALDNCFRAIDLLGEEEEFEQEVNILYTIYVVFYFLKDLEKQLEYCTSSYELAKKINYKQGEANALNGLGTLHYSQGEDKKAIEYLNKGLKIAQTLKNQEVLGKIYDGLGQANFHLGNFEDAKIFKNQCLEIVEKSGVKQVMSYAHDGLGEINVKLKDFDSAHMHFDKAIQLREEMGFSDGQCGVIYHKAEALLAEEKIQEAINTYQSGLNLAIKSESNEMQFKAHKGLSDIYEQQGELDKCLMHVKLYHEFKEKYDTDSGSKKVKAFELKGKLEQIKKEKDVLEGKNALLHSYFEDVKVLGSIGNEITSTLDIEKIFSIIYERINTLMEAHGIFIGICNYQENKLEVKLAINKGVRDNFFEYSLDDFESKLPVAVVKRKKEVFIGDYENEIGDYLSKKEVVVHNATASVIVIPLKVKEIVIGVLLVQSEHKNAFSEHQFNILKSFASYLSIALDNAWLVETMESQVKERTDTIAKTYENAETLNHIGQELISTLDFDDSFEKLYRNVNKLMDAEVFGVRLLNKENNSVDYLYEIENGKRLTIDAVSLESKNNYSVICIENNQQIVINDHENEYQKYVDEVMVVDGDFPYSLIFIPLKNKKEVIGAISVQSFKKNAYSDYHVNIVKTLAQYTVIALENARNYETMEAEVISRTKEITKSQENTKLLSEIGKEIASELSTEDIIAKVYANVNSLMDASVFGIGVYREDKNDVFFEGLIEKGEKCDSFSYKTDEVVMATKCFNDSQEIVINHWEKEYKDYIEEDYDSNYGEDPESIMYLPLISKGKKIGVITVQSFEINAYSDYHVNIVRSLSVSIASALENASLYSGMEKRVKERTTEIEKSYEDTKLISQMSRDIASSVTIEDLIANVYENVNSIMDAACFGIGIYSEENQAILMPGFIEKGEMLNALSYDVNDDRLASWCFKNEKEIFINDYQQDYTKYLKSIQTAVQGGDPSSILYVPLYSKEKIVGLITVQSFDKSAYTDYHMDILKGLAVTIGASIENALLYESLEDKVKERTLEVVKQKEQIEKTAENTKLLSEIGKEIAAELSSEDIISKVYNNVNQLMDASVFGIGVFREDQKDLFFSGLIEKDEKCKDFFYAMDEEVMATKCFSNNQEIIINDWESEYKKYIDNDYETDTGDDPESMIYMPLVSKEKKIGVITVQSFNKNSYDDYQVDILRTLSLYIASALENANLYKGMEDRVRERTAEIEKSYENTKLISQMSRDIAESLTIEGIVSKVYNNVNSILDAACFGIGIYDEKSNSINMPGFIEKSVHLENLSYNLDDERLASWCFNNKKEIVIQDYLSEYTKYLSESKTVVAGELPSSIIYIPLYSKNKIVGLITVQSFDKSAYTDYHLDILRGLAITIGGAIENALLYESLEDKVKERTLEVVKQKEQIEKTFENTKLVSEIGKEIAAELSSVDIISKVYKNVNELMDATIFGIGVYREDLNDIYFSGSIERGEYLGDFNYTLDQDKVATICFNNGQEIVINNWNEERINYVKEEYTADQGEMPESMIYLPLISKDKKIGVITVQSFERDIYFDYQLDILRTLSLYIASALENASLYKGLENRVKERTAEIEKAYDDTKLLSQISKAIVETLEVDTIIERVYQNVNNLVDATCFGLGIYHKDTETIQMPGFIENGNKLEGVFYDIHDKDRLAVYCFENDKEIHINDYFKEYMNYVGGDQEPVMGDDTNSIIYLPLHVKDNVIGVMTVQSYKSNVYTDYHLDILRSLATTIATAIDNAMLYENLEEKVRERTLELVEQKEIIEEKNKHITDSIRYAKRIQDATLPDIGLVNSYLDEAFVLFKPKDIVSGDFYWIHKVGDIVLFAVVDCTGHGVPGAFLSLIGHNSLNQIVNELKIYEPSQILDELNRQVYKTLQNNLEVTNIKDGMDMAICAFHSTENKLYFSGAYNPLYIVRDEEIIVVKGDKLAIGSGDEIGQSFTNNSIQLELGDCIYMFSDGYADQFGGPRGKKFKYSQFKELLVKIHKKEMNEQHRLLNHMIEAWQGDMEQIDDICVIGFRN